MDPSAHQDSSVCRTFEQTKEGDGERERERRCMGCWWWVSGWSEGRRCSGGGVASAAGWSCAPGPAGGGEREREKEASSPRAESRSRDVTCR